MLMPVKIYCMRPSALVLMAEVKKRNKAAQQAILVLNMKAYIPIKTEPSW